MAAHEGKWCRKEGRRKREREGEREGGREKKRRRAEDVRENRGA